jgi:hypothetical protein
MNKLKNKIQNEKKKLDFFLNKYRYNFFITDKRFLNLLNISNKLNVLKGGAEGNNVAKANNNTVNSNNTKKANKIIKSVEQQLCELNQLIQQARKLYDRFNKIIIKNINGQNIQLGNLTNNKIMSVLDNLSNNLKNNEQEKNVKTNFDLTQKIVLSLIFQRKIFDINLKMIHIITSINNKFNSLKKAKNNNNQKLIQQMQDKINDLKKSVNKPNSNQLTTLTLEKLGKEFSNLKQTVNKLMNGKEKTNKLKN